MTKDTIATFRPPAVPLLTHDPYFSVWSNTDHLYDRWPVHWTGYPQGLFGAVRIDGVPYRFCGDWPLTCEPMAQTGLTVTPTQSIYTFAAAGVQLTVTFTSPVLADDLDVLARPASYITFDMHATDGAAHAVDLFFAVSAALAINRHDDAVTWGRHHLEGLTVLAASAAEQRMLTRGGDDLRIEWGTLYLAMEDAAATWTGPLTRGCAEFMAAGTLPADDDLTMPRRFADQCPGLACLFRYAPVGPDVVSSRVIVAYDDGFSIEYLHRKLRPYWRRAGWGAVDMLHAAAIEYPTLMARCRAFDARLLAELSQAGGAKYAQLCALAYRQAIAAHKLCADIDGTPLFFSKENFSNGCIATVDVTYPSAPLFLHLNPELLRGMLTPIFAYASLERWRFPFAPHDLGTYPLANGQVYGGGETSEVDQMPVEECGNMLILTAALAKADGHLDDARKYWGPLSQWAEYLRAHGLNPANQLCTDDFAGHLAGNTNLSLKAILGIGAYADLARQLGETSTASEYRAAAESMAIAWQRMAADDDHYRLAFDHPGTWSQKYNLVWDRLLGLHLFPPEIARTEIDFYTSVQQRYGLPLDNRDTYTKLDWIVWTATLAEQHEDFLALVEPLYAWAHATDSRVPLTDWYDTVTGKQVGFQARSVVGGLFLPIVSW